MGSALRSLGHGEISTGDEGTEPAPVAQVDVSGLPPPMRCFFAAFKDQPRPIASATYGYQGSSAGATALHDCEST